VDTEPDKISGDATSNRGLFVVSEEHTTAVVQRYLNALAGDAPAEPIVRELLERSVHRLERLCATMLHRHYPRLTGPPSNLETDELLGGVVEGLLKAMGSIRPQTVRQFFALANQHMRWQLNDLARRIDERPAAMELREGFIAAPASSDSGISADGRRMLEAIDSLPEEEREVFGLVRLQGLTQPEAAEVVGVSVKTVQRRLNRASLLLAEKLENLRPV
jgi:RNA polymerase sigma factor (sigma-70 family)